MSTMHKQDAAAPSVQQIMDAIAGCEASSDELRELIAAALADAERKGAEAMREAVATWYAASGFWVHSAYMPNTIRALPLPAGERQAVLLTDEQVAARIAHHWGSVDIAPQSVHGFARSIESAVIAANNLEVHRG